MPNNVEKDICLSIDNLDFVKSLQFMNALLDEIASYLSKDGAKGFSTIKNHKQLS